MFEKSNEAREKLKLYMRDCDDFILATNFMNSKVKCKDYIENVDDLRYNITILGSLKRGKSTLLNVLMERNNDDISPISTSVCTSAIVKYSGKITSNLHGNNDSNEVAIVHYEDIENPQEEIPLERIREFVTEDENRQNHKGVRYVDVYGNFPKWSESVTIVDSPGQNSVYDYHDVLLTSFLPQSDAIIFLIAADLPLDSGDLMLLKKLKEEEHKKVFFVITKIDALDNESDLRTVEEFAKNEIHKIGFHENKFYKISAKPVYEGLKRNASESEIRNLKAKYGLIELERDLEKFIIANSDLSKLISARVNALTTALKKLLRDYVDTNNLMLNETANCQQALKNEELNLDRKNEKFRNDVKCSIANFEKEWNNAEKAFQREISIKNNVILDKICDKLNRGSFANTISNWLKLKEIVSNEIKLELQSQIKTFEDSIESASKKLESAINENIMDYEVIEIPRLTHYYGVSSGTEAMATLTVAAGLGIVNVPFVFNAVSAASNWGYALANAQQVTGLPAVWAWLSGSGNAAAVKSAEALFIMSTSWVIVSMIASFISIHLLKNLAIAAQKGKAAKLMAPELDNFCKALFKSFQSYKDNIIDSYGKIVEDRISDYTSKLDKIRETLSKTEKPEVRATIKRNIDTANGLLERSKEIECLLVIAK